MSVTGAALTVNCTPGGGSVKIETDGSATTPFTYLTLTFNNCVDNGDTLNGSISLNPLTVTKTSNVLSDISATFSFNFTVTNTSTSAEIYGGFTIAAHGIGSASRTDLFSGTSFSFKYGTKYETLTNFTFASSYDDSAPTHGYSDTVDYTFASDVILAGFDFHTVDPLVRNAGDERPRSGQVIISGANSTKLRATVVSADTNAGTMSGTLNLELDQGTGSGYGAEVTKTWTQLATGQ